MNKLRKFFVGLLLLVVAIFGLYGCGGAEATPTPIPPTDTVAPPTDTPAPATATTVPSAATGSGSTEAGGATGGLTGPAADLLTKSQTAMKGITSLHYTLSTSAAGGNQNFSGEGDYVAPDKARITISETTGTVGQVTMIIIGSDTYMKQPGSDQYMSLQGLGGAGLGNLAGLGNPTQSSSIAQFANEASVVGDENVDGIDTTHVNFTYDVDKAMKAAGQQMGSAAGTVIPSTPTNATAKGDIWIDKSNNYIHKMVFVTNSGAPGALAQTGLASAQSTVTIVYSKYNEPVNPPIEKPTNLVTLPGNVGTPVP